METTKTYVYLHTIGPIGRPDPNFSRLRKILEENGNEFHLAFQPHETRGNPKITRVYKTDLPRGIPKELKRRLDDYCEINTF